MPIKNIDYHDAIAEHGPGGECVSCGAPHGWPVYRHETDLLRWEACDDRCFTLKKFKATDDYEPRTGWRRERTDLINGFCRHCAKMPEDFRYRGVYGWQAFKRVWTKHGWKTVAIGHSSTFPHFDRNGEVAGVSDEPRRGE